MKRAFIPLLTLLLCLCKSNLIAAAPGPLLETTTKIDLSYQEVQSSLMEGIRVIQINGALQEQSATNPATRTNIIVSYTPNGPVMLSDINEILTEQRLTVNPVNPNLSKVTVTLSLLAADQKTVLFNAKNKGKFTKLYDGWILSYESQQFELQMSPLPIMVRVTNISKVLISRYDSEGNLIAKDVALALTPVKKMPGVSTFLYPPNFSLGQGQVTLIDKFGNRYTYDFEGSRLAETNVIIDASANLVAHREFVNSPDVNVFPDENEIVHEKTPWVVAKYSVLTRVTIRTLTPEVGKPDYVDIDKFDTNTRKWVFSERKYVFNSNGTIEMDCSPGYYRFRPMDYFPEPGPQ